MASKTSNSKPPQDQPVKIQSQLARVKKEEEEEELWISGEELYTEGSSDEEECKTQFRSRRRINNNQSSARLPSTPNNARSHLRVEIRGKKEDPDDLTKNKKMNEGDLVSRNIPKSTKMSLVSGKSSSLSAPRETRSPQPPSATKIETTSNSREPENRKEDNSFASFSRDEIEIEIETEKGEISWKAKRGTYVLPNSSNPAKEELDKC